MSKRRVIGPRSKFLQPLCRGRIGDKCAIDSCDNASTEIVEDEYGMVSARCTPCRKAFVGDTPYEKAQSRKAANERQLAMFGDDGKCR